MTTPRHLDASSEAPYHTGSASLVRLDHAVAELRDALRPWMDLGEGSGFEARVTQVRPRLAAGGQIILTDEGLGIARAVAADLKALGHPVLRVRHGVGDRDVEGLNLTSTASVAALIDRARSRAPIAAVAHLAPLRPAAPHVPSWDDPDDARALALLAQASAEDLKNSALAGGSCLIVARNRGAAESEPDRLSRWVEISAKSLSGVRVRGLTMDDSREREVLAAEIVRVILGADEAPEPKVAVGQNGRAKPGDEPIFLGAPDRAAWIHVAAALLDWLDESPTVRLVDLGYTLHRDQPSFPFRVGLVASCGLELAERLRRVITQLADPECSEIQDPGGAYWFDAKEEGASRARSRQRIASRWGHRLIGLENARSNEAERGNISFERLLNRSGRSWMAHLAAWRFANDGVLLSEAARLGREARILDLAAPLPLTYSDAVCPSNPLESFGFLGAAGVALDVLDEVVDLRRVLVLAMAGQPDPKGK